MKKVICIIVSLVMIFSITGFAFAKREQPIETPIIIIPGFLQTNLQFENGDGTIEKVWVPDFLGKLDIVGENIPDILLSLVKALADNPEALGESLMDMLSDLMPKMMCNPDGTSLYNVLTYENDPEKRNLKSIKNSDEEVHMQAYYTFANYICKEGYAKEDNVFIFEYDGRMDAITNAEQLRTFVKAVKEYTGKDKVTLFGVSYGGQIEETYLHLFMDDGDIEKAVFSVPSLGGTNFGERLLGKNVDFALDDVVDIIESMTGSDTQYSRILKDVDSEFFSRALNGVADGISEYARYWGSVYSLTAPEYYDGLKEKYLDSELSAELIRKNDIIHYEIMPAVKDTLNECRRRGIDIAIHACSGLELALGGEENSDLLLPVTAVTGATCAPMGKRFADGFTGAKTECSNPDHHHVSPSMEVDASTAYLPENTWFVDGSHHAMFQYENYGLELAAIATCTDRLKDVHSDPEFPQFRSSDNPSRGIYAEFDSSLAGFVSEKDSKLTVENVYRKNKVKVLSVTAKGADLDFSFDKNEILKPGEKLEINFSGELPKGNAERIAVTVKFIKLDAISALTDRTFDFTFLGGEKTESSGEITDNEFYLGGTSGMPVLKRAVVAVTSLLDLIAVAEEFLTGDAFKYLL